VKHGSHATTRAHVSSVPPLNVICTEPQLKSMNRLARTHLMRRMNAGSAAAIGGSCPLLIELAITDNKQARAAVARLQAVNAHVCQRTELF
jgi:hypothetical protein